MTFDRRLLLVSPALLLLGTPLRPADQAIAAQAPTPRGSLCAVGDQVIFSCGIGRKMVSVCGRRTPEQGPIAQYRYGAPGNIELAFPGPGQSGLSYAREMYSGGGAMQIRFSTGGYDYAVYSRTIRTGFGRNGRNNPQFSDGVMVRQGNRLISNRSCTTQTSGDAQPQDFMPEGTMMEWFD